MIQNQKQTIAHLRAHHQQAIDLLDNFVAEPDSSVQTDYALQYAELMMKMAKPHIHNAMVQTIGDEGESNVRVIADLEVSVDGKMKFTEEF